MSDVKFTWAAVPACLRLGEYVRGTRWDGDVPVVVEGVVSRVDGELLELSDHALFFAVEAWSWESAVRPVKPKPPRVFQSGWYRHPTNITKAASTPSSA